MMVDDSVKILLRKAGHTVPNDIKIIPALLRTYPLDIKRIESVINKSGATYVIEPLLIYNKFLGVIKLTVNPQIGDQVIKVLRFNPNNLQSLLSKGYYTTGVSMSLRDNDVNILIISKDEEHALYLKSMLENIK